MKSRIAALTLGILCGVGVFAALELDWDAAMAELPGIRPDIAAAAHGRLIRLAWSGSMAATAFAAATLLVALLAGLAEAFSTRRRLTRPDHDRAMSDRWIIANWRSAFAGTAAANLAEAIIAGDARAGVGALLLAGLEEAWLERLTLDRIIAPLPAITLGWGGVLALMRYGAGPGWELALAAGAAAWLAISVAAYLVRLALGSAVAAAIRSATAAIRASAAPAGPGPQHDGGPDDPATAAMGGVDPALQEVRAGIERLLARDADD
jgi:hypothetical protein